MEARRGTKEKVLVPLKSGNFFFIGTILSLLDTLSSSTDSLGDFGLPLDLVDLRSHVCKRQFFKYLY